MDACLLVSLYQVGFSRTDNMLSLGLYIAKLFLHMGVLYCHLIWKDRGGIALSLSLSFYLLYKKQDTF